MDGQLAAFVIVATVLTITPGPDTALVARNVLRGGFAGGLMTSVGILSGLVVWAALSALGIAALVATSALLFSVLKVAGAAYLIALGVLALWHTRHALDSPAEPAVPRPASVSGCFREGLLSNLLNPKVGIFYTSLLPQFVDPGQSVAASTALLACIHLGISVTWLVALAYFVAQVRSAFARPRVRRALDRLTGAVLVGFGLRVAKEST